MTIRHMDTTQQNDRESITEGISVVFFDLDHTLWDFERNSAEALSQTLHLLGLVGRNGLTEQEFIARYHVINDRMWDEYRRGLIAKSELRTRRFDRALALFSIREDGLAERFARTYLDLCPRKQHLLPGARQTLEQVSARYPVWLLTNGFSEVQTIKVDNPDIKPYIRGMVTSEQAEAKKPSPEIFLYAARQAGVPPSRCAMIGDDLQNDVLAAVQAGFCRGVWFSPKREELPQEADRQRVCRVSSLLEVPKCL